MVRERENHTCSTLFYLSSFEFDDRKILIHFFWLSFQNAELLVTLEYQGRRETNIWSWQTESFSWIRFVFFLFSLPPTNRTRKEKKRFQFWISGVQEAFYCSSKVLTVSLHKHEPGFFPSNSGSLEEIGDSWGRGFNINFPFRHGVNDEQYLQVFSKLLSKIVDSFNPEVFVVQCGGDTLFADPMKSFNLTSHAIVKCVKQIIDLDKPTLLLGGGGYNIADTARLWTSIVAMCLDVQIDDDIPEHDYFSHYGPDFTLKTWPGNRPNKNDQSHLDEMFHFIEANQIKIIQERNHHSEWPSKYFLYVHLENEIKSRNETEFSFWHFFKRFTSSADLFDFPSVGFQRYSPVRLIDRLLQKPRSFT